MSVDTWDSLPRVPLEADKAVVCVNISPSYCDVIVSSDIVLGRDMYEAKARIVIASPK